MHLCPIRCKLTWVTEFPRPVTQIMIRWNSPMEDTGKVKMLTMQRHVLEMQAPAWNFVFDAIVCFTAGAQEVEVGRATGRDKEVASAVALSLSHSMCGFVRAQSRQPPLFGWWECAKGGVQVWESTLKCPKSKAHRLFTTKTYKPY